MNIGVVTDRPSDGRVEVTLVPGGSAVEKSVHDLKRIPPEQARKMPSLYNFTAMLKQVDQPTKELKVGSFVAYKKDIMEVLGQSDGKVYLRGNDEKLEVPEDDVELVFNRSWGDIHQGQIVWKTWRGSEYTRLTKINSKYNYEAAMIKEVNPETGIVLCYSMYDGAQYRLPWHLVKKSKLSPRLYPNFMLAIADDLPTNKSLLSIYMQRVQNNAPGKSHPADVLRQEIAEYCVPLGKRPYGAQVTLPPPKKKKLTYAQQQDALRDDAGKRKITVPLKDEPPPKTENTTVLLVGAAGVILFLLFKK